MGQAKMLMGEPPDKDPKRKISRGVATLIVLVLLLGGGLYFYRNHNGPGIEKTDVSSRPTPITLQEEESPAVAPGSAEKNLTETLPVVTSKITPPPSSKGEEQPPQNPEPEGPILQEEKQQPEKLQQEAELSQVPIEPQIQSVVKNSTNYSAKSIEENNPVEIEKVAAIAHVGIDQAEAIQILNDTLPAVKRVRVWTVQSGEHLWGISKDPRTFGNPYKWRAIYEANRIQILNPDLIYPGQKFKIPNN